MLGMVKPDTTAADTPEHLDPVEFDFLKLRVTFRTLHWYTPRYLDLRPSVSIPMRSVNLIPLDMSVPGRRWIRCYIRTAWRVH